MTTLEENTSDEPWDSELRSSLNRQLIYFLENNSSTDPTYLVGQYQGYLLQLIQAQTRRLREKYGDEKQGLWKESGVVKRIINKIPEAARRTFENNKYNPDKKVRDTVFADAEYEVDEEEEQQSSTPKRPGSTFQLPEAKMAARPATMTSRNSKQDVVPSEAQVQTQSRGADDERQDEKNLKEHWSDPNRRCTEIQQKLQTLENQQHRRVHPWDQHPRIHRSQQMNQQ